MDCQKLASSGAGRAIYLPFPPIFAKPSNPFLPPEFFHDPPRKYTTAFDVWQFGVLALYIITGFLPKSYGDCLISRFNESQAHHHVSFAELSPFDDPHPYPRLEFFYDWLDGISIYNSRDQFSGERGECLLTSEILQTNGTVLSLDAYKLKSLRSNIPCTLR